MRCFLDGGLAGEKETGYVENIPAIEEIKFHSFIDARNKATRRKFCEYRSKILVVTRLNGN